MEGEAALQGLDDLQLGGREPADLPISGLAVAATAAACTMTTQGCEIFKYWYELPGLSYFNYRLRAILAIL